MEPTDGRVREPSRCSFCTKPRAKVSLLIAGSPGVFICDECVGACTSLVVLHRLHDSLAHRSSAHPDPD